MPPTREAIPFHNEEYADSLDFDEGPERVSCTAPDTLATGFALCSLTMVDKVRHCGLHTSGIQAASHVKVPVQSSKFHPLSETTANACWHNVFMSGKVNSTVSTIVRHGFNVHICCWNAYIREAYKNSRKPQIYAIQSFITPQAERAPATFKIPQIQYVCWCLRFWPLGWATIQLHF